MMKKSPLTRKQVLLVDCPFCRAVGGSPCVQMSKHRNGRQLTYWPYHTAREIIARLRVEKKPAPASGP